MVGGGDGVGTAVCLAVSAVFAGTVVGVVVVGVVVGGVVVGGVVAGVVTSLVVATLHEFGTTGSHGCCGLHIKLPPSSIAPDLNCHLRVPSHCCEHEHRSSTKQKEEPSVLLSQQYALQISS